MDRETLKKAFTYINERLFDDLLPMPILHLVTAEEAAAFGEPDTEGFFFYEDMLIGIHEDSNIFDTLVHEMIHLWQFQNHKYMGHGGWFLIWSRKAIEEFYTTP